MLQLEVVVTIEAPVVTWAVAGDVFGNRHGDDDDVNSADDGECCFG